MKLLIATFLKDYQEDVQKIFRQAQIPVFSIADVTGFKNDQAEDLLDDWFASGDEKYDSQVLFTFTDGNKAELALELLNLYNSGADTKFPVRGFIVPVEKSNL